jgi:hypothetical protein
MTEAANEAQQSSSLIESVAAFLSQQGWTFEQSSEQMLVFGYRGEHGEWLCYALCRPELAQCLFFSVAPMAAPEVLRPAVAEFVTRANWGMVLGNFELDYRDGEIRFKTSIQVNETALTSSLLHPLIFGNLAAMDRYFPGLQAVIGLQQTPSEAISAVEQGSNDVNDVT